MTVADRIIGWALARKPDLCVGGEVNPYMRRWYVIPRNRLLNIYVHQFMRDDEDRAQRGGSTTAHGWFVWEAPFLGESSIGKIWKPARVKATG